MSLIMRKYEIYDDFLNVMSKNLCTSIINYSYEFYIIGTSWNSSQEEKRITNFLKNEDKETKLMKERFIKFSMTKREPDNNLEED